MKRVFRNETDDTLSRSMLGDTILARPTLCYAIVAESLSSVRTGCGDTELEPLQPPYLANAGFYFMYNLINATQGRHSQMFQTPR